MGTMGDIFWPIAHVLVRIEDQIHWTRHVMLPLSFTHEVHFAVVLVHVVTDVSFFFITGYDICCNIV